MFQFQLTYSYADFLALNRATTLLFKKWRIRLLRGLLVLFGFALLTSGILLLTSGEGADMGLLMLWYFIVVGVLLLVYGFCFHYLKAWSSLRLHLKNTGVVTVTLTQSALTAEGAIGREEYTYAAFLLLARYQTRTLLYLDKKHAVILPAAALVQGDPAALTAFLEEKCGKPLRILR